MNQAQEELIKAFKNSLIKQFHDPKTLVVLRDPKTDENPETSDFIGEQVSRNAHVMRQIPPLFLEKTDRHFEFYRDSTFCNGPFDLIFCDLPLGLMNNLTTVAPNIAKLDERLRTPVRNASWEMIFQYSKMLTEDGIGIFTMPPQGFNSSRGEVFLDYLNSQGFYVSGYVNLPENVFAPLTTIRPILTLVKRNPSEVRVCEISSTLALEQLAEELTGDNYPAKITKKLDQSEPFRGFDALKFKDQIKRLETRYKEYKTAPLSDLLVDQHLGRAGAEFDNLSNSIFVKILGSNASLFTEQKNLTGRPENYIQLVFKGPAQRDYVKIFFESSLGQLSLKSLSSDGTFGRINWRALLQAQIPIPSDNVQVQIVETVNRFNAIEQHIGELKTQVYLNPASLSLLSKIDSILEITKSLTEGDKIKSLILQGESKLLEFKQTFEFCLKEKTKQKYVEDSCLKTIVGFLNSDGGTLLIGVEDSGIITGIDDEKSKFHRGSTDRFLLHLKNKISTRIGKPFFRFIDTLAVEVDDKLVIKVLCKPSDQEVFLDEKDFYIRTSPSTDKLEGKNFISYVKSRFSQ